MKLGIVRLHPLIFYEIEEYLAWRETICVVYQEHKDVIWNFARRIEKKEIKDIEPSDLITYFEYLRTIHNTQHSLNEAVKAIRCFIRYYRARKYTTLNADDIQVDLSEHCDILKPMKTKKKLGRPLDIETRNKVAELRRTTKLSFRQIARVVEKDVSQVHYYYKQALQNKG